jgi:large subunit ribosomal protein L10
MKELIIRDYEARFEGVDDAMLISIRGVDAISNNKIRLGLAEKDIQVTVLRNALAKSAFKGTNLEALVPMLEGPNALVYGAESVIDVARQIVDLLKEFPDIGLNGAVLDGELFEGAEGVRQLSTFPTRDEAIVQAVTLILSPARNLVGQIKGPGSRIVGLVKAIEEKLEKGEAIAKAG